MRMSKSGRGHWQLRVYAPDAKLYHSLAALLRALEAFPCDAAERQRELLATVLLQTAFRSFAWARTARAVHEARVALEARITALGARSHLLVPSALALGAVSITTPKLLVAAADPLSTVTERVPVLNLMWDPTGMTRTILAEAARDVLESTASDSLEYATAKSIGKCHYPIVVGLLPQPRRAMTMGLGGRKVKIVPTQTLSNMHSRAAQLNFGGEWHKSIRAILQHHGVMGYDFSDQTTGDYLGSIVLTKVLTRLSGELAPAISIDSIVSISKGKGTGNIMFEFARRLLFTDAANITHGYLFAQCLPVTFWDFTLDPGNFGRTFAFQMAYLYAHYHLESNCVPRFYRFGRYEDGVLSPAKKVNG